jgi:site-specific DNA-methyltransferase (adenine-specific)
VFQANVADEEIPVVDADLIVTSPPYLGVLRYGSFNWLRLWFLGFEPDPVERGLDSTNSLERYLSFMLSALTRLEQTVKSGAFCVLVLGNLRRGGGLSLAREVAESVIPLTGWVAIAFSDDVDIRAAKTTRIWGEERRGMITTNDQTLTLRRL